MDAAEEIAGDRTHGAAWLSLRALELLRDGANDADDWTDVAALARDLRDARPAMHVVANRVDRAMADADDRTPDAVARAASEVLRAAADADEDAAANAAARLGGSRLLTLSRSGTVTETLRRAGPAALFVLESRPALEGVEVAESVAAATEVTLATDAAVAHVLATGDVDAVLVGSDAVRPDGSVVNKVGTRTAATVAAREGVEVVVVCARDKVAPAGSAEVALEPGDPSAVYDGDADLTVANPTFDRTPAALVDAIVTEDGVLDPGEVRAIAEDHAALADWDDP